VKEEEKDLVVVMAAVFVLKCRVPIILENNSLRTQE
jgi:hypothetical protein